MTACSSAERRLEPAGFVGGLNQGFAGPFRKQSIRHDVLWGARLAKQGAAVHQCRTLCADLDLRNRRGEDGFWRRSAGRPIPHIKYQELQLDLSKGGTVVVYTDGVTDALNSEGEEFGESRLIECCNSLPKAADAQTTGRLLSEYIVSFPQACMKPGRHSC